MITPNESQPRLAKALGLSELIFKREDLHPLGSHKGRSIPLMIDFYATQGFKHFAISSSGNAARAAAVFIKEHNQNKKRVDRLKLTIFIGKKIHVEKSEALQKVASEEITVKKTKRPIQKLFELLKNTPAKSLRQSTDDIALLGYKELARELSAIANLKAVFIPTSSGTTAEALGETFKELNLKIQIHIVQTSFCHPISEVFDKAGKKELSIADAIVDMTAHRKRKVLEIIKQSGGSGWTIENTEIESVESIAKKTTGIELSKNSALAIAGLQKALRNGWRWSDGVIACLITGK